MDSIMAHYGSLLVEHCPGDMSVADSMLAVVLGKLLYGVPPAGCCWLLLCCCRWPLQGL